MSKDFINEFMPRYKDSYQELETIMVYHRIDTNQTIEALLLILEEKVNADKSLKNEMTAEDVDAYIDINIRLLCLSEMIREKITREAQANAYSVKDSLLIQYKVAPLNCLYMNYIKLKKRLNEIDKTYSEDVMNFLYNKEYQSALHRYIKYLHKGTTEKFYSFAEFVINEFESE